LDQMAKCKKARETEYPDKEVVLSTYEKNAEEDLDLLINRLKDRFGEDLSWLKICNGIDEFEAYLKEKLGG